MNFSDNDLDIINRIKNLPLSPGVYLWKDINDNVIYVGKAKNIKNRMLQYFEGRLNSYKTNDLVNKIIDFDVYLTKSEKEALILEKSLIEKYSPQFNILLLDDKRYPYIKVSLNNKLIIKLDRRILKDNDNNTLYFGPFPQGFGAKQIIQFLESELLYENGLPIVKKDEYFWKEKYNKAVEILSFKDKKIIQKIDQRRFEAEQLYNYELAKDYYELSKFFTLLKESQQVELDQQKNIDVIDIIFENNYMHITTLYYIYGVLINKDSWSIKIYNNQEDTLLEFLERIYQKKNVPDEIYLHDAHHEIIKNNLEYLNISYPKIGAKKAILDMAHKNNLLYVNQKKSRITQRNIKAIESLKNLLKLKEIENIIAFDNSTLNNESTFGVAIAYSNGLKNKSLYRKFDHSKYNESIINNSDDEYMYHNVLRYYKNNKYNVNDLIIIDGAITQLKKAKKALKELDIKINIISLVKDDKHKTNHILDANFNQIKIIDQDLYNFLASIQIEVDRFAKEYLRNKRITSTLEGSLAKVKGIGSKQESKLLEHFGTYAGISNASLNELKKVVSEKVAEKIVETLKAKK
ncbi:GIY-YIG nuclease family protein [Mycoplasma crocodyli]|uniref:Excinuclease UvrABC system, nuclease subunit (UvrC) n=1 Tax=Mycoplasma crocodyli (strain ATCC 51981 / MP145) TaxID=512564 RepID=D5E5J8_MYCCM|nr:GIY-YIG nuclease family protein [Mycoplasma crocodyli]ADE19699.1 excinuclease UvrABC system, nuclease subunit (UvrC) [Mycoplasma crocodyli MP145]